MAKKIFILLFFINYLLSGHSQDVHQHLTLEGYSYLKQYLNFDIPEMLSHLGSQTNPNEGSSWQNGTISAGAWLEDDKDVVYNYDQYILILDGWHSLKSITHFWDADNSNNSVNTFTFGGSDFHETVGTYPNAYTKIKKYAYNNRSWDFRYTLPPGTSTFTKASGGTVTITHCGGIWFSYNNIIELYKTGRAWVTKYYNCPNSEETPYSVEIILGQSYRNFIVWEILGRMAHLFQDMSVPAHAHIDAHGIVSDQYEDWVGTSSRFEYWNHQNTGGISLNVNGFTDPLHFLMYTTQQITDHFGSTGPHGNGIGDDNIAGDFSTEELTFLNSINLSSLGAPTYQSANFSTVELTNIRDKTFPHIIRATASLFYWFAAEAGIIPETYYLTFTNNFSGISETFNIKVDGTTVSAPSAPYLVIEDHTITVEADQNRLYNNVFYKFSHWSDESTAAINIITASQTETITAYYDAINPPSAPQNLSVTESSNEHPLLSWDANSEPEVSKYNVYMQENYNGWNLVGSSTSTSYEDVGVTTTYRHGDDIYYKITAVNIHDKVPGDDDEYELESDYSNTVEIEARLEKNIKEGEIVEDMPKEYALNSNYPNPFNPTTQISYQIPNDGFVNLTVYNSLGQEIAALVNKQQSIGRYTVQFNANNLSSGIYFYRIAAGEFNSVKKMLLVR